MPCLKRLYHQASSQEVKRSLIWYFIICETQVCKEIKNKATLSFPSLNIIYSHLSGPNNMDLPLRGRCKMVVYILVFSFFFKLCSGVYHIKFTKRCNDIAVQVGMEKQWCKPLSLCVVAQKQELYILINFNTKYSCTFNSRLRYNTVNTMTQSRTYTILIWFKSVLWKDKAKSIQFCHLKG